MLGYRAQRLYLLYISQLLLLKLFFTAAAPISNVAESLQLTQSSANITGITTLAPYITNTTSLVDFLVRGPAYRYDVPHSNTWLNFRFHGARKIEHKALILSLISAIDEIHTDIKMFGAGTHVNENKGPFNQHSRGCMFTISSTTNPDKVRRMTYSMRMDTLVGLYNVLVKAKRDEAAEFLIYYEGLGLVGVGTIDEERRVFQT